MDKLKGKYHHARTCVYNVNYHIIWCVKYRRKVLIEPVAERLCAILDQVAEDNGFELHERKVGEYDHIHCFVSSHPKLSITQIVRCMKGISGNKLLREFPEIRKTLWKGHLWSPSYFVETIGSTSEENVRKYIERQKGFQH